MTGSLEYQNPVTFLPGLRAEDPCANYWMRQVILRLRREICWCWYERGMLPESHQTNVPPFTDKVSTVLEMSRFWEEKKRFYVTDPTARYLTEQLDADRDRRNEEGPARGSFGWVVDELVLDDVSTFVLALGLEAAFDSAVGSVVAACLNDPARTHPDLALAQKLWDDPDQVLRMADPAHELFAYGLLHPIGERARPAIVWESPITVPWSVANRLLSPDSPLPHILNPLTVASSRDVAFADGVRPLVSRLSSKATNVLRIVPIRAPKGSAHLEVVQGIAEEAKREVVEYRGDPSLIQDDSYLNSLVTSCWLAGKDLFLDEHVVSAVSGAKEQPTPHLLREIPATVFLGITERSQLAWIPDNLLAPIVEAPALSYPERVEHWRLMLGTKAGDLDPIIAECSRRFRYGKSTIEAVAEGLKSLPKPITNADFLAACRAELALDISSLAREVVPRFEDERLILPRKQDLQFRELVKAVRSLTEVHYGWGTARIWNEVGISALFAGPPGTGKTMAAEILARELELPMYRIDLSQVVNKYIGETEKNLKQLFDAADVADIILFFDEADSLFGRRTEVRDAHDRYANLEVSYLLERMERFKGVAILATNRKQDLDEAFLRRLRFIVDFPSPGMEQREEIWRQLVPDTVDTSQLDFDFLARRFDLTGGHINSIVFYACLQGADGPASLEGETHGRLTMENIVIAVKREYEKSNRSVSLEHFGPYAEIIERTEYEDAER